MKYTLICAVVAGLLASGVPVEATVVSDGIAKIVKTAQRTETEKAGQAKNAAGAGQGAQAENAAGTGKAAEAETAAETGKAAGQPEIPSEGISVLSGGIWAELQPEWNVAENSAGKDGAAAGMGLPSPGEGGQGVPAGTGSGIADGTEQGAAADGQGAADSAQDPEPENEYADLAIADVRNYVNVRSGPDTGSTIVGKIYAGAVAQILETVDGEDGEWFRVVSGNVEGYMKSEFFLYGDAAAEVIDNFVTRYAVVLATRLNVREEADIGSRRIGYIDQGEKAQILENLGDWIRVQYTEDRTGYVAAEYITVAEEFVYAKTLEEEAAELAAKKALEQRQHVSEEQAAENTVITVTPPSGAYSTNAELRSEIVAYAMQFLGNRYVHGGQSLTTGTDCSGFTSLIYAQFGYSVSRTPAGQLSGSGRSVSYSEAQPGDIICYGSRRCTHVALYIGDGQIIHAANSRKGVVTQRADYDNILGVKNIID